MAQTIAVRAASGGTDGLLEKIQELYSQRLSGRPPMAYVRTYGCQQNVSDGEKIKGLLDKMGFSFVSSPEQADFILFNTCAVRENAEQRVFGNVGQLKRLKAEQPHTVIALCGCMMQQQHVVDKIRTSYPYVDIVFGTQAIQTLPRLLHQVLLERRRVFDTQLHTGQIVEQLPTKREAPPKAWVPIMYGCDNFCSYCVVPHVRGREVSRQPQAVLDEVAELVKDGYKDITLLGQNVNSYGKGLTPVIRFEELLLRINALPGEFRIRFMTSHPKDCTVSLIDTMARCEKVCRHIHLPVQSGSDRVLDEMNRHYTCEEYLRLVRYARKVLPDVAFTSDIIVGFPGETYEEFLQTVQLIRVVEFDSLYTFIYSKRVGTKAETMPDPVPAQEKSRWFRELLEVQDAIGERRYRSYVGKPQRVLVDSVSAKAPNILCGRNEQNLLVELPGTAEMVGSFQTVIPSKAVKWALVAE